MEYFVHTYVHTVQYIRNCIVIFLHIRTYVCVCRLHVINTVRIIIIFVVDYVVL